jgi:hypothetical protein
MVMHWVVGVMSWVTRMLLLLLLLMLTQRRGWLLLC